MATVLKHGVIPYREKLKYNGRILRMKIYRFGGLAPIKKSVKIRNEQIIRLVFAPSDRPVAQVLQAVRGENVTWCLYVSARSKRGTKTFKFEIVRKALLARKEDTKTMNAAIDFAREVARWSHLSEQKLADGSFIFSRERVSVPVADLVRLLDNEATDNSSDEEFSDDEPDDD